MLRGTLLAALADERDHIEDQQLEDIVEDVMKLQGVEEVIRPDMRIGFETELGDLLRDVQDIWYDVQHSTQVFQSSFARVPGAQVACFKLRAVEPLQDGGGGTSPPNDDDDDDDGNDNDGAMLFPMVVLLGEEQTPVAMGTVVRTSQMATLIREEGRATRVVEAGPSRPKHKSRTLSLSSSVRTGQAKEAFLPRAVAPDGSSKA